MRAGLMAGSLAAILAALVSLPLHSPSDTIFNSLTVVIGVLITGLLSGVAWQAIAPGPKRFIYYVTVMGGGLIVVVAAAAVAETQIDRMISFVAPLAAIAFVASAALVPLINRITVLNQWWPASAFAVLAFAVGFGLAGQGDQASGELSLPPRPETQAVAPESNPTSTLRVERDTTTPAPTNGKTPATAGSSTPTPTVPTPTSTPEAEATPPDSASIYVVGAGSAATFTVTEQLVRLPAPNEAVVRTDAISGDVDLETGRATVQINLHALSSDQDFRDGYIRRRMFPNSPVATFTVESIGDIPDGLFSGETVTRQVAGSLNIRNTDVPLKFDIEVRLDGDLLLVLGRTSFTWEQFGLSAPTARPIVFVDDEVRVEVLLHAALQPAGGG